MLKRFLPAAALLLACAIAGSAARVRAAEPVFRVTLGVIGGENDPRLVAARSLADSVAVATDGKVGVEITARSGDHAGLYSDLIRGALDLALIEPWVLGQNIQQLSILGQPFLFRVRDDAHKFYRERGGERVVEIAAGFGIAIAGWLPMPPPVLLGRKFFASAEDFSGMTVAAAPNPLLRRVLAAMGAQPTPLPDASAGQKLQSGSVNAVETGRAALAAGSFPADATHVTESGHDFPVLALCLVKATSFRNIPPELQRLVAEAIKEAAPDAANAAGLADYGVAGKLAGKGYRFEQFDRSPSFLNMVREATESSTRHADKILLDEIGKFNKTQILR